MGDPHNYQYDNQLTDQSGNFQAQSNFSSYSQPMPQFQQLPSTSLTTYNMQDIYANVQHYQAPQSQHNNIYRNAESNQSWNISKNKSSYIVSIIKKILIVMGPT
jgi:hypothetical protein